jgi:transglutaminase-like putative cysteine protease
MAPAAPLDPQLRSCLVPSAHLDFDHPRVLAWAAEHGGPGRDAVTVAVALYHAVRDGWRYDPYTLDLDRSTMRASAFLDRDRGYCVEKANLLAAACRAWGIPARLGFGDVRNHLGTEKLEATLGTDLMVFHGYAELWLEGRWVKATPAFNRGLCDRLGVPPLDFDGRQDAVFQAHAPGGRAFMTYETDRGHFDDWPADEMERALREHYGHLFAGRAGGTRPLEHLRP